MELRHLRYFRAVADEMHFGRAAKKLGMAQPPLSQQIQNLERELEVKLFDRSHRNIKLTDAGVTFLKRTEIILEASKNAATEAKRVAAGMTSNLTLGFMSSAMLDQIVPLLQKFRAHYPDAEVDMLQMPPEDQLEAVAAGRVDIGFIDLHAQGDLIYHEGKSVSAETAWHEAFVVAMPVSHRLANHSHISLDTLVDEKFVTMPREPAAGFYDQTIALCQKAGFSPQIINEASQLPVMLSMVAAGYGIALVPACACQQWVGLVGFADLDDAPLINVTMISNPTNESPVVEKFRDIVRTGSSQVITKTSDRAQMV